MTELPTNLATEGVDPRFTDLDTRDVAELVRVMNAADAEVTDAVAAGVSVEEELQGDVAQVTVDGRVARSTPGTPRT